MSKAVGGEGAVPGGPASGSAAGHAGVASGAPAGSPAPDPLAVLRDPATIRLRCAAITEAVAAGRSPHFTLERGRLEDAADRVAALTRARFPDLRIPPHSRWRHFEAGGVDRKAELDRRLAGRTPAEIARARIDLTVVSVLLDAGAGAAWRYQPASAQDTGVYTRSEGLAVASFDAFVEGAFSCTPGDALRVDAQALQRLDAGALQRIFQVSADNPLVGLEGRAALLSRLGTVLLQLARAEGGEARPGRVFDTLQAQARAPQVADLLGRLLRDCAPIWRSGSTVLGLPAGDVWPHPFAGHGQPGGGQDTQTAGWVPFHKLSQWLTYSLLEPFEWAGLPLAGAEALTGLPEYRNGGLLLDCGVIVARRPSDLQPSRTPADEFVVEWRALTVTLLDELAERVRARLGPDAQRLPLACVLEGGTWAAGRQTAQALRGGMPPFPVVSDGTVF